ncbi:MAG: ABC transporter permease [Verrucomicrobiota bacterium]|nr:ABC transporter permease [Verrucomicrobiota bacterium]
MPEIKIQKENEKNLRITLSGRLDISAAEALWSQSAKGLRSQSEGAVIVDLSAVDYLDVSGTACLVQIEHLCKEKNLKFSVEGMNPDFESIYKRFTGDNFLFTTPDNRNKLSITQDVGKAAILIYNDLCDYVRFFGELSVVMVKSFSTPHRIRWHDTMVTFEKAGVNALAVVALISFLVGLIISFQAAIPMKQFGVEIFVVDLLTIAVLRELGAFMTALVLAGRSGSAFAAEIGTMKVNEEVSALVTMGVDPIRFLVVSRMIAGIVLMPFLTMFANVVAIAGGLVVMLLQGFTVDAFFNQFKQAFNPSDLWIGLFKSLFFGGIVAGAGCYQGLKTLSGPTAVGDSTTKAVVSSIVIIVTVDGIFSIMFYFLGI